MEGQGAKGEEGLGKNKIGQGTVIQRRGILDKLKNAKKRAHENR